MVAVKHGQVGVSVVLSGCLVHCTSNLIKVIVFRYATLDHHIHCSFTDVTMPVIMQAEVCCQVSVLASLTESFSDDWYSKLLGINQRLLVTF